MKADVTAENKPAYSPGTPLRQHYDRGGWGKKSSQRSTRHSSHIRITQKVTVVLVCFALELVVELDGGAASRSKFRTGFG